MYFVLQSNSSEIIEPWEAWSTFIFFFILIALAFMADKINYWKQDKLKSDKQKMDEKANEKIKITKTRLRKIAKKHTEGHVIGVVQGTYGPSKGEVKIDQKLASEIKSLYQ